MSDLISRRTLIGAGAAGVLALALPKHALAALTSQNTVTWYGRNTAEHAALVAKWAPLGFRTLSLSIYGEPNDPRYAAVMVQRPAVHAEWSVYPRSQAALQSEFDAQAKKGFGPYILSATGPRNTAAFAASFRPMAGIPLTRANLSQSEFDQLNADQHAAGAILTWVDVFGDPSDPRFAAIWGPNPGRVAWSLPGYDAASGNQQTLEDATMLQQRFDALATTWGRPAHIALAPAGKAVELFVDSTVGAWGARAFMTASDLQTEYDKQAKAGLQPVQISARGSGSAARFAAIFATREETDPRTYRSQGPVTVASIDTVIKSFMQAENLRGATLAIAKGAQLVYAKGYTFAEPGYPDITPQTPIRQASVSKTFTGVAMWSLLQSNPLITVDTPLQSILKLGNFSNTIDKNRWNKITLRHLLESDSGLNQGLLYSSDPARKLAGNSGPATPAQLLNYATTYATTGDPGDPNNAVYGNFDYFLLGQVIAKLQGTATYEAALKQLVLDPLHQTHTRLARSLVAAQPPGEARHHMTVFDPKNGWPLYPFEVTPTVRGAGAQLVPTHYGNLDFEMFSSAGGLSSSAVDMARLGAMFSVRAGNPILKPAAIDTMMKAIIDAGSHLLGPDGKGSHGYYGLDWAYANGPANMYTAQKGGWLPGQGTILQFTTGGFTYAMAINGNGDVNYDWLTPIDAIAQSYSWGNADLFASAYGMPTLVGAKASAGSSFNLSARPPFSLKQVKESMSRAWVAKPGSGRGKP